MLERIVDAPNQKIADIKKLQQSRVPLVMYGTGSYARYVARFLEQHGIHIDGACVDEEYLPAAGGEFLGKPVLAIHQLANRFHEYNLLLGFVEHRTAREKAKGLAGVHEVFFIDSPHHLDFFDYQYVVKHRAAFEKTYDYLADARSRDTFTAYLNAKIMGQPDPLFELVDHHPYFNSLLPLGSNEVYVDCGAYDGDTILKFYNAVGGKYKRIIAFECDEANSQRLLDTISTHGIGDIQVFRKGIWSHEGRLKFQAAGTSISTIQDSGNRSIEVDTLDHLIGDEDVTFMKMDIEGAEIPALIGAQQLIQKNRPKLAICVYHKPQDLIEIPQFIKKLVPEYKLWLRHHQFISWETVLYASL